MTTGSLKGVRIAGVASAVPEKIGEITDDAKVFNEIDTDKIIATTGVHRRHMITGLCTSDLCFAAAQRLLQESSCHRESIDTLIFVSQTPDYLFPATSCSLHGRLKMRKDCAAFDLNLGCSGYVYGLWLAANLIASGSASRILLLAGDTITVKVSALDRSAALLFGDAGTATLIEKDVDAPPIAYTFGTDGTGQKNLIVPAGGSRQPHSELTSKKTERENGNIRSDEELFMDGAEIFTFSLREVPSLIQSVLQESGWDKENVDAFIMHQANKFILQHLAKRMKLPKEKVVIALENYGNTSSASIPLAMTDSLSERLKKEKLRMVLAGFGVGYSWGAIALNCGPMVMPEVVIVPEKEALAEAEEES